MTARRALPWLAFLAACATPAGDTGSPSVDSDNREDSAPVVCTPEPPEQVLPSADRVIDDLQAWEGAEAWPDGCVLGFGSWDEVVRRPDGTDSLVADVYCSRGFGNILVVDVAAAEFTAAYSVPTPAAGNVGWDANVDGDCWLHVSGLSGVGFAADNAWTYDERTPDTFGSIALGPDLSWFGTAWMGERLFVLGMAPTTDARGAFRFLPDTREPQTLNNAEAYFPDWYSAADVGDADGDGLDDLVAYVRSDSGGAVLVSSADAMAGPDGLPAAFAKPALVDWKFFDGSRPVGDQDGDGHADGQDQAVVAGCRQQRIHRRFVEDRDADVGELGGDQQDDGDDNAGAQFQLALRPEERQQDAQRADVVALTLGYRWLSQASQGYSQPLGAVFRESMRSRTAQI